MTAGMLHHRFNEPSELNLKEVISEEAGVLLKRVCTSIPRSIMGPDRVTYLSEQLKHFNFEEKNILVDTMNNLLKVMIDKEASDIEVGGFGTEGFVWLRVYGKKRTLDGFTQI